MHLIRVPKRPDKAPAIRITVGLQERSGQLARLLLLEHGARRRPDAPRSPDRRLPRTQPHGHHAASHDLFSSSRITAVRPLWAVEGGRVTIEGDGFVRRSRRCREVRIGGSAGAARAASPHALTAIVPAGLDGGHTAGPDRRARPARRRYVEIGAPLATGVHQVDSPAFDARRQSLRHLQRIARAAGAGRDLHRPAATARASRSSPTCRTRRRSPFDRDGRLYVSSRFDGSVYRVDRRRHGRRCSHATSASRAGSRSGPTARSTSAIAPDRFCA